MKAILEFNLPAEDREHYLAVNGADYFNAIQGTLKYIREQIKYAERKKTEKKIFEEIQAELIEQMRDRSLKFDPND
jgi:hypothetical protein